MTHEVPAQVEWAGAQVEALDGGLLNYVWRVRAGAHSVVVKHAPGHIAASPQVALSASRSTFEAQALRMFDGLEGGVHVPTLLAQGLDPHVVVMEDLGDAPDLRQWLAAPSFAAAKLGHTLGAFVGDLHARTWGDSTLLRSLNNRSIQRTRFHVQYRAVGDWAKGQRPRAQARAFELGARLMQSPGRCMIMGDLWPPSVLVRAQDVCVIDWEMCHFGQPLQDVAHLLAHLWLLEHMSSTGAPKACARGFMQGYVERLRPLSQAWSRCMWIDATTHMGVEALARLLGPFGAHYGLEGVAPERLEWMRERAWEMVASARVHPWFERAG